MADRLTIRAALALLVLTALGLGLFVRQLAPAYRSAVDLAHAPVGDEPLDGLFAGAAVQFLLAYRFVAAGALLHLSALAGLLVAKRRLRIPATLVLGAYGLAAGFVGHRLAAPALAAAAATSLAVVLLLGVDAWREPPPEPSASEPAA
ncbi:MAG: hypothetical protein AB7G12_16440 [Thermoanaerobaculia bacterium]